MFNPMLSMVKALRSEEEGQSLVEYALIIVLVSIALITALQGLQGNIQSVFDTIGATLGGA
jgi:pilus assembly protein Flp/PilA